MSQSFTYDDLNRLTQAVGSAYGTQSFTYDSIGNMTSKAGRTMTYGAGSAGPHAVTGVSWNGTNYPTFARDFVGSCTLEYDDNGNMTKRGQDTLSYDSENRLKEMKTREGVSGTTNYTLKAGWNVISFTHLPDDKSVTNVLVTAGSLTFGTDFNQVSTWDSASGSWKHWVNDSDFNDFTEFEYGKTYEIYNNSGSDKSLAVTGITNGADLTHGIVSGDNFISPAVKAATNITTVLTSLTFNTHYSDVKRFNATTQLWESFANNDFTQFEPGKGYNIIGMTTASFSYGKTETTTTFVYDSTGQRVKKTVGGTTTTYLGKDYDLTGGVSTKYIFLGDRRIATKDSGGTLQFIHDDHISSSNVITDDSGDEVGLLEYDPYGQTVTQTGAADPKHKFTGQESDDSTRLYYYGARYYDPQLGRFITADDFIQNSRDPQSFNRYSYARNNPIRFTDPTGNFIFAIFAAIFAFVETYAAELAVASILSSIGSFIARRMGAEGLAKGLGIAGLATGIAGFAGAIGSGLSSAANSGAAYVKQVTVTSYQRVSVALGDGMVGTTFVPHTVTVTIIQTSTNFSGQIAGLAAAATMTAASNAINSSSAGNQVHLSESNQANEAPKSEPNQNETPKTFEDIKKGAEPLEDTGSGDKQYLKKGGQAQAEKDFESLEVSKGKTAPNGTKHGELSNGDKVNVRSRSTYPNKEQSYPTIERQPNGGGPKEKIRYKP